MLLFWPRSLVTLSLLLPCLLIGPSGAFTPHIPEEHVSTSLYGSVTLPCTFPFIQSLEGLTVMWDRGKVNNRTQIVYWIWKGKENLEEQISRYRRRVELSNKFPQGNLDLTLRDVTYEDEGTYYCRAANKYNDGDKKVTLSIDGLDADDPIITQETIDGKRRLKCMGSGVYRVPQVQWIAVEGEDLSRYGRLGVTEKNNGRKLVESVLDHELEENVEVWCHITEGRLRKSAQFNTSDTEEENEQLPNPDIVIRAAIVTIIFIVIVLSCVFYLCRNFILYGNSINITEERVYTSFNGSATLPCSFPFVNSLEGLTVIWEKEENGRKRNVYRIMTGEENLEGVDPRYRGRVKLSTKVPQGSVDLTLRDVTHEDTGTYCCRASNNEGEGNKKVTLSIDG